MTALEQTARLIAPVLMLPGVLGKLILPYISGFIGLLASLFNIGGLFGVN